MKRVKFLLIGFLALLFTTVIPSNFARADVEIQELQNVFDKFLVGMEVNAFYRFDEKPAFGSRGLAFGKESTNWGEIFARMHFSAIKDIGWANVEAKLSPVFLATIGENVYWTIDDDNDVDLNQGYVKFGKLFGGPFDFTFGMQNVKIEKQFLIGIGRTQEGAAWVLLHDSFPWAFKVDGDFGSLKCTAFWARSQDYFQMWDGRDNVDVAGINLHLDITENNYVYAGFYQKIDDSGDDISSWTGIPHDEHSTHNFNFGLDFTFGGFNVEAEAVFQGGDVRVSPPRAAVTGISELDRDSYGFFVAPKYTFNVPYSPYIKFHYIFYSGDEDPADDEIEEYDSMFWGFPGWARWVIGEQAGEHQLANTNKKSTIIEAGFSPMEILTIYGMFVISELDEPYFPLDFHRDFGTLPDDEWGKEFNLFVEAFPTDNLFIHFSAGWMSPDDAAEAWWGADDTSWYTQLWIMFYF